MLYCNALMTFVRFLYTRFALLQNHRYECLTDKGFCRVSRNVQAERIIASLHSCMKKIQATHPRLRNRFSGFFCAKGRCRIPSPRFLCHTTQRFPRNGSAAESIHTHHQCQNTGRPAFASRKMLLCMPFLPGLFPAGQRRRIQNRRLRNRRICRNGPFSRRYAWTLCIHSGKAGGRICRFSHPWCFRRNTKDIPRICFVNHRDHHIHHSYCFHSSFNLLSLSARSCLRLSSNRFARVYSPSGSAGGRWYSPETGRSPAAMKAVI